MLDALNYPYDSSVLLRKKKRIRQELLQRPGLREKRVAILGGSTTAEVREMLELFLLRDGLRPRFYESAYNRFAEEALFDHEPLKAFAPEVIYLHTTSANIRSFPAFDDTPEAVAARVEAEFERFRGVWDALSERYACPLIQNNFEWPRYRVLGNRECCETAGRVRFVAELNHRFSREARRNPGFYLNDIQYLSACIGLDRWHDPLLWHSGKYALSYEAIPHLAASIAAIIGSLTGTRKKCLVLDLDNTLWGGVIGDDGPDGIRIGRETPEAEAYTEFQHYVQLLRRRGVLLAVCSKNDRAVALEGLAHPDSVLKPADFSAFVANWEPKDENLRQIARDLEIGTDSLVFVDDNPAERELVRAQLPEVAVPELAGGVARFIEALDRGGYFEPAALSAEDLGRSAYYAGNAARREQMGRFACYDDYLRSLEMTAEIRPFAPVYFDRIAQLAGRTNQFNLTTRRYTAAEIAAAAVDPARITLCGRLVDRHGDNGLVSVLIGTVRGADVLIDLWVMSCRVLRRGMEFAMFDRLVDEAIRRGATAIVGRYLPTEKNGLVSGLFRDLGFVEQGMAPEGGRLWRFACSGDYGRKNRLIGVKNDGAGD